MLSSFENTHVDDLKTIIGDYGYIAMILKLRLSQCESLLFKAKED